MMQPVPVVRSAPVSGANRLDRSSAHKTGGESFMALLSQQLSGDGPSVQRPQSSTGASVPVHGPEAKPPHATEDHLPSTEGSRPPVAAGKSELAKNQMSVAQRASAHPVEKKPSVQGSQPQGTDLSQMAGGMIGGGATAAVVENPGTNSGTPSSRPVTKKFSQQSAQAGQMAVAALAPSPMGMPPAKPEQKTSPPVSSETAVEGALFSSSGTGRMEQGPVGVQKNTEMTSSASGSEANFLLPIGANGTFPPSTAVETSSGQGSSDSLAVSLAPRSSAHTVSGHSALDGLLMSPGGAAVGAETVSSSVMTPLGQTGWGSEFSQKVTWMVGQSQQSAELHLNPPDLGPLSVVVQVSGAQADAFFSSPHAAVREAIQHALPHLREMLAGSGLSLGQATVSDQGSQGFSSQRHMPSGNFSATKRTLEVSSVPMGVRGGEIRRGVGLVDTFA
ncbi:flagellar hook-length control protein FliK [Ferrovum sp.]|uniref:flagellar hook-length control protein FliK n=1 Tax=Ferrovum sp. TaxID=2609467 RepID=UPI00260F5ABF|nr:flagellar hook-length control protein FliK [Ferrovum sp.]